jgi:hypothetical protein
MTIIVKTPGGDPFTFVLEEPEVAAVLASMGPSMLSDRERVMAWAEKALLDALEQVVVEHAAPQPQHEAKME